MRLGSTPRASSPSRWAVRSWASVDTRAQPISSAGMAHLHRQADADAPLRRLTGDGRGRYPGTVITTDVPGVPSRRRPPEQVNESTPQGDALRDPATDARLVPTSP